MFSLTKMEALKAIYIAIMGDKNKERFEMILEPFQAIVQLALLSYCPVGSKLSITDNILHIQNPGWSQSIMRSYNSDKHDDLVYLFTVIKRFHLFYGSMKSGNNNENRELFRRLVSAAKKGLERLIQTYSKAVGDHLSQTLHMYIQLLDRPDSFQAPEVGSDKNVKIDDVFIKITELYCQDIYSIVLCNLRMIEKDQANYHTYMASINNATYGVNLSLKKWMSDNIMF